MQNLSQNTVFLAPGWVPGCTIRNKILCCWCLGGGMNAHFDAIYCDPASLADLRTSLGSTF